MPPKSYDLLRPVYGDSLTEVLQQYHYDPVNVLITTLNMIIGNLDQYSEDEILEALPRIEREINNLPINDAVKQILCDTLWNQQNTVRHSLELITLSLKNIKGD